MDKNIKSLLVQLQNIFERTTIFEIPPHYERWEDGFQSIDAARAALAPIKTNIEHSNNPPAHIISELSRIFKMLNDFVPLRDDFRNKFPGRGDSHGWDRISEAERLLTELQRGVSELKSEIKLHIELSGQRLHSPEHIRAGNPVIITMLVITGIFGILCIFGGVKLMNAPGSGATTFSFVGLGFSTQQAGVAAIALGAVVILLTFRRILKTIDSLGRI